MAGAVSNSGYWQKNHFYYDKEHEKSKTENFIGWNVKGGANYNLTERHNVFANIGYISKASTPLMFIVARSPSFKSMVRVMVLSSHSVRYRFRLALKIEERKP